MNDQRRIPVTETHEQQSYIDERLVDTESLPVPVEVNVEEFAIEERIKQKQEAAKKERDELKETLNQIMKTQKESIESREKLKAESIEKY